MNDIILRGAAIKRELTVLLISFVVAFGVNVYAVIAYETQWSELLTSMGFVLILTLIFYLVAGLVRLLIKGIIAIVKGKSK